MDVPGHVVYGRDLGKQPFCVRVRFAAIRGSAMRDARASWWVQ